MRLPSGRFHRALLAAMLVPVLIGPLVPSSTAAAPPPSPAVSAAAAALGDAGPGRPEVDLPGHVVGKGEKATSLDGEWSFHTDPDRTGESSGWTLPETDVSGWDRLPVPGNWDVHDRYATYRGAAFYRREFTAPKMETGEVARLRLDALFEASRVWLNGELLGTHRGGYTPFEFDVSDVMQPGGNTVVLEADNRFAQGAWWPWGGPSRSVAVVINEAVRVREQRVIATPDLDRGNAVVSTEVTVENNDSEPREVVVSGAVTTRDRNRRLASSTTETVVVPAGEAVTTTLTTRLEPGAFELWHVDNPALYRFATTVSQGPDQVLHEIDDRFGIRKVELRGTQFFLNGEQMRLNGYNRVTDDRVHGNTEPTALVRRDLDRMKAAGANMMRLNCVPQAPELLDYADEIGLLVISEVPVWGGQRDISPTGYASIQAEMREMARRDFNHPSVFAYSVGNEIAAHTPTGREYDRVMADFVRNELDPTRLVTQVSNSYTRVSRGEDDGSIYMDFVSINMYGDFAWCTDKAHNLYPDKPIFVSEFSPDSFNFPVSRESRDFRTRADDTEKTYDSRPWVMGSSMWTFNDYRSNYSGSSPNEVRGWGVQTVWGEAKRAYAQMQSANAPVDSLRITSSAPADSGTSLLELDPRGARNEAAPAFTLRGYRLAWQVTDVDGAVLDGGGVPLPDIEPGDQPLRVPVRWSGAGAAVEHQVSLLSPTGHEVAVAGAAVRPPGTPTVTDVVTADGALRVAFREVASADGYQAVVTAGGTEVARSAVTTEDFVDVTGLAPGVEHEVSLVAVNAAGQSSPSPAKTVTPTDGEGALPPQLQALVPVENGLVLGYSDADRAARHEVRVLSGNDAVQSYVTDRDGATRIEGLAPGTSYGVQVRRLPASGVPSAWSETRAATTLGASSRPTATIHGALTGDTWIGVRITPDPNAERYEIRAGGRGRPLTRTIEASAVDLLTLDGLEPETSYRLTVRVQDSRGWSAPVSLRVETTAPAAEPGTLAAPIGLSHQVVDDQVVLSWSAVNGASGYLVSRVACEVESTVAVVGADPTAVLGPVAEAGGSYRVSALAEGLVGTASEAYGVPANTTPRQVLVDDADTAGGCGVPPGYAETGSWFGSALAGWDGGSTRYSNATGSTATWTPDIPGGADYNVEVFFPSDGNTTQSAQYTITHAGGTHSVLVNQRDQGGAWVSLGTWAFDAGTAASVRLTVGTAYHRTDSVRFTPAP